MPDSRSRSPPPRRDERRRSRSPRRRRDDDRPKHGGGGFRWKEKRRDDDPHKGEDDRRLDRGYRDRNSEKTRDRPRSPPLEEQDAAVMAEESTKKAKKEKKVKKASGPAPTAEPMIIVNVNDRLGTKASIPCLASDPISKFTITSIQL